MGYVLLLAALLAQTLPEFEVASIKPNVGGIQSGMTQFRGGRFTTRYRTLKNLIGYAYRARGRTFAERQVIGGPDWLDVDRFDIEATAPGIYEDARGMIPEAVELRVRRLLEDRCALRTHIEQRQLPIYALVLARRDGTLGPGLHRRSMPCVPAASLNGKIVGKHLACGGQILRGLMVATGATTEDISGGLERFLPDVDRVIVDRTGLIGYFDVDMTWPPELSFFTALEEQLGLKLEPTKGDVDVLVVDHIERPTPD